MTAQFEEVTFQRCPHDKENPYVMISRALVRDKSISPECRWLIIYLLTNTEGFIIRCKQIINHLRGFKNCGRDRVYEIIEEAVNAGYLKRETIVNGNLKNGFKYTIAETPKFKKFFRHPESQDTGAQDTENTDYKNKQEKEKQLKNSPPPSSKKSPPKKEEEVLSKKERIRKKIEKEVGNKITDQEFEVGWSRYLSRPSGEVRSPVKWIIAVIENDRSEKEELESENQKKENERKILENNKYYLDKVDKIYRSLKGQKGIDLRRKVFVSFESIEFRDAEKMIDKIFVFDKDFIKKLLKNLENIELGWIIKDIGL